MVSIVSLWLPILLSAVVVFIISSVLHTVFTHHNSDFKRHPAEDQVMDDLRKYKTPPGDYMIPYTTDAKERKSESISGCLLGYMQAVNYTAEVRDLRLKPAPR